MIDLENKIIQSKESIASSNKNNPHEIYENAINKKRFKVNIFNNRVFLKSALSVFVVIVLVLMLVLIFDDKTNIILGSPNGNLNATETYQNEIENVKSLEMIKELISIGSSYDSPSFDLDLPENSFEDIGISGGISQEYNTNVQVEGVDEADIVKVNGDYIYYVTTKKPIHFSGNKDISSIGENALFILKKSSFGLDIVDKIIFDSSEEVIAQNDEACVKEIKNYQPVDLFYTDKYNILNVSTSSYNYIEYGTSTKNTNYKYYNEFHIIDINTHKLVTKISVPGRLMSSRLIGNELYIIGNYSQFNNSDDYIIPKYGIDDVFFEASLDNIFYCPGFGVSVKQYVVIFKVTLLEDIKIEDVYFLSPAVNYVYMNQNSIHLIRNYSGNIVTKDGEVYTRCNSAKIMVVDVNDGLSFDGVVRVEGSVNDKYWVDEYEGYLRIASTGSKRIYKTVGGVYEYDSRNEEFNSITIFNKDSDGKWQQISQITEGLGEVGESMKSARFNGVKATVVTFRQTDPLYYIDLTNPYNPVITSELKVSGYTVYQHPYKDNYVIGIGYEANENGITTGYKVAIFDISDSTNIKEVGEPIVFTSNEYYHPAVINNPKALFLDLKNDIFGFAINNKIEKEGQKFFTFKIDLSEENPLTIFYESKKEVQSEFLNYSIVDRMVFIDDNYYLLATDEVYVYKLIDENLELQKIVELK